MFHKPFFDNRKSLTIRPNTIRFIWYKFRKNVTFFPDLSFCIIFKYLKKEIIFIDKVLIEYTFI